MLADPEGAVLAELAEATVAASADGLVAQLAELCRRSARTGGAEWSAVGAVAVGVPGVVAAAGIEMAPNLPPLEEADLATALATELGVPVVVENDVNLATEGEHRRGHGLGVSDFVFVAVGTGVGMGIVAGGRLQRGASGAAGEIASLPVGGATLEEVAGGVGVARRFAARGDGSAASARGVFDAAEAGDAAASEVLEEQAAALAQGLVAVQSVLDPALVVLGGGIGSRRDVVARVERELARAALRPLPVRASALGARAGVVGAVEVAREHLPLAVEGVDA